MKRAVTGGVTLEYEVVGAGEPVVLIHRSFIADAFRPLLAQPPLASHHQLITYHRRGYVNRRPFLRWRRGPSARA